MTEEKDTAEILADEFNGEIIEELYQVQASLNRHKSMMNSIRVEFDIANEHAGPKLAQLLTLQGQHGWLSFLPGKENIKPEDVVDLPEIETKPDEKSPSQRLRQAIWSLWNESGRPMEDSETYYRIYMQKLIDHVHEKTEDYK